MSLHETRMLQELGNELGCTEVAVLKHLHVLEKIQKEKKNGYHMNCLRVLFTNVSISQLPCLPDKRISTNVTIPNGRSHGWIQDIHQYRSQKKRTLTVIR